MLPTACWAVWAAPEPRNKTPTDQGIVEHRRVQRVEASKETGVLASLSGRGVVRGRDVAGTSGQVQEV